MSNSFSLQWNIHDKDAIDELRDFRGLFPSKYHTFKQRVFAELVALSKKYSEEMKNE